MPASPAHRGGGSGPQQQKQRVSAPPPQKRKTQGESFLARCSWCRAGAFPLCVRWRCRGLPLVPVLSLCCPPSSPAAPVAGSWCRLAAVSVCCPVLPEAVVGASRATRGRLASTQGCHRCSCPSRWARPLALRTVAVAAFPARSASTQEQGQRPRQQKQRVSTTLSKKKRNSRESAQIGR